MKILETTSDCEINLDYKRLLGDEYSASTSIDVLVYTTNDDAEPQFPGTDASTFYLDKSIWNDLEKGQVCVKVSYSNDDENYADGKYDGYRTFYTDLYLDSSAKPGIPADASYYTKAETDAKLLDVSTDLEDKIGDLSTYKYYTEEDYVNTRTHQWKTQGQIEVGYAGLYVGQTGNSNTATIRYQDEEGKLSVLTVDKYGIGISGPKLVYNDNYVLTDASAYTKEQVDSLLGAKQGSLQYVTENTEMKTLMLGKQWITETLQVMGNAIMLCAPDETNYVSMGQAGISAWTPGFKLNGNDVMTDATAYNKTEIDALLKIINDRLDALES